MPDDDRALVDMPGARITKSDLPNLEAGRYCVKILAEHHGRWSSLHWLGQNEAKTHSRFGSDQVRERQ